MATKRDYYEILGVAKTASADEIKSAYRKLAREHHPDMVGAEGKVEAEKKFKEINEAYQILGDAEKRRMYDQFGHAGMGGAGGPGGFGGNTGQWGPFTYTYTSSGGGAENFGFDPFDIFEDVFGFRGFSGSHKPRRGKNLMYEMHIDFVDAVKGSEKEISVETGKIKIKIPQGARDGTELRFTGKGQPGPEGAPAGDLYISLRVKTPKPFERYGDDFVLLQDIDFVQATLGDVVEVPVIDPSSANGIGHVKMKIPAGTQPGAYIKLKGKGMPRLQRSGQGDVVVKINVKIPTKLSRAQKEVLEKYRGI